MRGAKRRPRQVRFRSNMKHSLRTIDKDRNSQKQISVTRTPWHLVKELVRPMTEDEDKAMLRSSFYFRTTALRTSQLQIKRQSFASAVAARNLDTSKTTNSCGTPNTPSKMTKTKGNNSWSSLWAGWVGNQQRLESKGHSWPRSSRGRLSSTQSDAAPAAMPLSDGHREYISVLPRWMVVISNPTKAGSLALPWSNYEGSEPEASIQTGVLRSSCGEPQPGGRAVEEERNLTSHGEPGRGSRR